MAEKAILIHVCLRGLSKSNILQSSNQIMDSKMAAN